MGKRAKAAKKASRLLTREASNVVELGLAQAAKNAKNPPKPKGPKGSHAEGWSNVHAEKAAEINLERARKHSANNRSADKPLDMGGKPGTPGVGLDRFVGKDGVREMFIATFPDGTVEEHWLACPPDHKRCTGNALNGVYKGQRCRKPALRGARVCLSHGGSLPSVRKAAELRVLAAQDLAIQGIVHIAFEKVNVSDADRLRALTALLDRGGMDGKQTVVLELKPWQEMMEKLQAKAKAKASKQKAIGGGGKHKIIDLDLDDMVEVDEFAHWEDEPKDPDE